MSLVKQGAVAVLVLILAFFAWARLHGGAPGFLSMLGMQPGTVAALTGTSPADGDSPAVLETGAANATGAQGRPGATGGPGGGGGGRSGGGRPPALVVTESVGEALINDRLNAVGNGTPRASVTVVPLSAGVLTEVAVQSGQLVSTGDVLARLDSEEQVIARDRAARAVRDATDDVKRLESLYRSRTSTQVEVNNARAELADATLALRDAELKLSRRTITAPIDGIVGIVPVEVGNYVTTQTEIVTIDDRSLINVEFWIPERFAGAVSIGQSVNARAFAIPGVALQGEIAAIGSRVETDSRTLPVRASIDNADDTLRPGMSFEVTLRFAGDRYVAIDPLSVQWDSNGSYVWRVVNGKVQRVTIRIVQRNPESVLVDADLAVGDAVVTEGLLSLRPGADVRVAGGGGGSGGDTDERAAGAGADGSRAPRGNSP